MVSLGISFNSINNSTAISLFSSTTSETFALSKTAILWEVWSIKNEFPADLNFGVFKTSSCKTPPVLHGPIIASGKSGTIELKKVSVVVSARV